MKIAKNNRFFPQISDPESGATLRNLSRVAPRFLLQGVTANHPVIVQVRGAGARGTWRLDGSFLLPSLVWVWAWIGCLVQICVPNV